MSDRNQILEAEASLFEMYLKRALVRFKKLKGQRRWNYMRRLKALVESALPFDSFDFEQARRIRDASGMSRQELVKLLKGIHELTLYKYETGRLVPKNDSEPGISYLKWLSDNGYKQKQ